MNAIELLHHKAGIWQRQIAGIIALANEAGEAVPDLSVYYQELESLYERELPLARTIDNSDLVVRFAGPSVETVDPSTAIVSYALDMLRQQIIGVSKSISGLMNRDAWLPDSLEPRLGGLAQGSLFVGVRIPRHSDLNQMGQAEIELALDPFADQIRNAISGLPLISQHIHDDVLEDSLKDEISDPGVRDAMVVATSKIAPSGRRGINKISLLSSSSEVNSELTPITRKILRQAIGKHSDKGLKTGDFIGQVRKVDLDARRIEIRNINGLGSLRCAYQVDIAKTVSRILDCIVEVRGKFESDFSGRPRLLYVEAIKIIKERDLQTLLFISREEVPPPRLK